MGQKVNPIGLRLILNKKWQSNGMPTRRNLVHFYKKILKSDPILKKN